MVALWPAAASAAPKVDGLLCKRTQAIDDDKQPPPAKLVIDVKGDQPAAAANADGSRAVANPAKVESGGFLVVDAATKKSRPVHSRDRHYDCDMAVNDDGTPNSVRWLGNDVIFAQGVYCDEFDAKPFLAAGKTGKFIGFVKLKGVSPEAVYNVAHLDKTLWAISVWDHNQSTNVVVVVDTKNGAIKSTTRPTDKLLATLPECPK